MSQKYQKKILCNKVFSKKPNWSLRKNGPNKEFFLAVWNQPKQSTSCLQDHKDRRNVWQMKWKLSICGLSGKICVGLLVCQTSGMSDKWNCWISWTVKQVRRRASWASDKFYGPLSLIETPVYLLLTKNTFSVTKKAPSFVLSKPSVPRSRDCNLKFSKKWWMSSE